MNDNTSCHKAKRKQTKKNFLKIFNTVSIIILVIAVIIDVKYSTNISGIVFFVSSVIISVYTTAKLIKKDNITAGEKLFIFSAVIVCVYAFIDAFFQNFEQEHLGAFSRFSEIIYILFLSTSSKIENEEPTEEKAEG